MNYAAAVPRARNTDPSTSHAAAGGIGTNGALHLAELVVAALQEHGPMTTHEIAELTGQTVVTISPRIKPLREAGLVAATGDRRDKRSVWMAI